MSELAETQVQQAEAAIQAGEFGRAMDLLRKARLLAAANQDLTARILVRMVQIAPRVGADDEVQTWRQLLSQLRSIDGLHIPSDVGAPVAVSGWTRSRAFTISFAKYGAVLLATCLLALGAWWYWGLSASRYRPTTAGLSTAPSD